MASKLRKGDKVVVLAGKDKGKEAEITSVNPKTGKAIVQGIPLIETPKPEVKPLMSSDAAIAKVKADK